MNSHYKKPESVTSKQRALLISQMMNRQVDGEGVTIIEQMRSSLADDKLKKRKPRQLDLFDQECEGA